MTSGGGQGSRDLRAGVSKEDRPALHDRVGTPTPFPCPCPRHTLAPAHFADRGYNGLQFSHAANCWARNVTVLNADNGLFVTWTDRSTFRGEVRIRNAFPETLLHARMRVCIVACIVRMFRPTSWLAAAQPAAHTGSAA